MKKVPLQKVRDQFGSKDKLVDEILGMIKRPTDLSKEVFKRKLSSQSNRKLLILLDREQLLKKSYGSRAKLVDAIAKSKSVSKKAEDKDYRKRLDGMTTGQLLDIARRKSLQS